MEIPLKKKYTTQSSVKQMKAHTDNDHMSGKRNKLSNQKGKDETLSPLRAQQILTSKGLPWTEDYATWWGPNRTRNIEDEYYRL